MLFLCYEGPGVLVSLSVFQQKGPRGGLASLLTRRGGLLAFPSSPNGFSQLSQPGAACSQEFGGSVQPS